MATKRNEDSSLMDKIIDRIKGSGKGGPNQVDPAQKKSALFHMVLRRSHAAVFLVSELHGSSADRKDLLFGFQAVGSGGKGGKSCRWPGADNRQIESRRGQTGKNIRYRSD